MEMYDLLKSFLMSVNFVILLSVLWMHTSSADKECVPRRVGGQSVVCVCNATYCDEITRVPPKEGRFVTYTSSRDGSRFKKSGGTLDYSYSRGSYSLVLDVNTSCSYQTCEGFGGAVTDSAGINWRSLPPTMQKALIDSYFSDRGLEYNMMRVPIGGCDFSTHEYAYNELPAPDPRLLNFALAPEDYLYKIPMIKEAMEVATAPIHIVSTTWSPPAWMKTDLEFSYCGSIAPQYYQTYADYHLKFLEKYREEGVPIWALTTTNEPSNGLSSQFAPSINCLGWTPDTLGFWIENNLGPTIRSSSFNDVKILCCDDQRPDIPFWFNLLTDLHPKALDYIDGVAVHFYEDNTTSPVYLTMTAQSHPDKFILATEACEGFGQVGVLLGSWDRAKNYVLDILQDLNHYVVGWIDWNLCLNPSGGPTWPGNIVDSPVIVDANAQEFYKQPMFYALGHFSKFIPRGSRRVASSLSRYNSTVSHVAFATPRDTVVVVLYNDGEADTVTVRLGGREAAVPLEAHSVTTVELRVPSPSRDNRRRDKTIEVKMKKPIVIEYEWGTIVIE